jgi:predicted ArsR family transcriptional regulator
MATRAPAIDYRQQVMACLRKKPMRTSELAEALGLEKSKMRQTGLRLQSQNFVRAEIVSGRGKGEYLFTLVQDDLFWQSTAMRMTFWQRLKYLFRFSPT